jgi:phosphoribosyl 1,2-cyclic phosphodiesterase
VLVNDDLLVDYGPDTSAQCIRFGIDLTCVKHLLITHSHGDHLTAFDLEHRKLESRLKGTLEPLAVLGNQTSLERLVEQMRYVLVHQFDDNMAVIQPTDEETIEEMAGFLSMKTEAIEPHQTLDLGRYIVHPVHARHKEHELSLNYIIDDGSTRFLYGTDTGPWADSEWEYLDSLGITLDIVALDCTVGLGIPGGHHSNESFLETKAKLEQRGLLSEGALFYAHHFSHQWNVPYDDVVEIMAPHGVRVTYDGLMVEK